MSEQPNGRTVDSGTPALGAAMARLAETQRALERASVELQNAQAAVMAAEVDYLTAGAAFVDVLDQVAKALRQVGGEGGSRG